MCSKSEALLILKETYEGMNQLIPGKIKHAYLYGSYARNDFDGESDIDILITADIPPERTMQYQMLLSELNSDLSLRHNVTVCATIKSTAIFEKYANTLPFYRNVLKEGIPYAR